MIRSLFGRLAVLMIVLFLFAGGLLLKLANSNNETYSNQVQQSLHRSLAHNMIEDNALLKSGRIDQLSLANTFHSLMLLGPAYEIYTVDKFGEILMFSADPKVVKLKKISLEPIQQFLQSKDRLPTSPLYGDDPRDPQHKKIFSVAPIKDARGAITGYLYVILHSQQLAAAEHNLLWNAMGNQALVYALVSLGVVAMVMLIVFAQLANPVRKLNEAMNRIRQQQFRQSTSTILPPQTVWASSEVRQLQNSFEELLLSLAAQFHRIENEEKLRRDLLSHITHDLKTPLASLRGYLETWVLQHTSEPGHPYIEIALRNAKQLNDLVDQLVELARLEGGIETLRLEPIAIAELAQDVMNKFSLRAQEQNIALEVTPQDAGLMISADIGKLERILSNLIDNALRHTARGGVIRIELSGCIDKGTLLITVRDTGTGIVSTDLEKIFEPNYRGQHGVSDNAVHLGLGLAIVKRLLELHQSHIEVSSQPGVGSAFNFDLPLIST